MYILALLVLFSLLVCIVWLCAIHGCEIGSYQRAVVETEHLRVSGSRRGKYALSYSSDDDLSSLVVDVEGQMSRFVAIECVAD